MIADDAVIAYTLELPWKDNNNNISCIPNGTYKGILRYDKNDKWRIELKDVPDRTNVQIHVGNFTKETKGCILVGNNADKNGCAIKGSTTAYKKLKEAFYENTNPSSTPDRDILLTIK